MKLFEWNEVKNQWLKEQRDISFESIVIAIQEENVLDIINHPDKKKYSGQKIYVVAFNNYAYLVPFVEDDTKKFLKTIIPSRKATKKYILGKEGK